MDKSKLERFNDIEDTLTPKQQVAFQAYVLGGASVHIEDSAWDSLLQSAKYFSESEVYS